MPIQWNFFTDVIYSLAKKVFVFDFIASEFQSPKSKSVYLLAFPHTKYTRVFIVI
jgi:hypothetical protein